MVGCCKLVPLLVFSYVVGQSVQIALVFCCLMGGWTVAFLHGLQAPLLE